jgi:hypothetical protein
VFEWQAAVALIRKDAECALTCLFDRLERLPEAPVGTALAEGAALFASESGDPDMMRAIASLLADRSAMLQRFSQFGNAVNGARDLDSEKTKERFFERYGGTYWYYYLFVDINPNR